MSETEKTLQAEVEALLQRAAAVDAAVVFDLGKSLYIKEKHNSIKINKDSLLN